MVARKQQECKVTEWDEYQMWVRTYYCVSIHTNLFGYQTVTLRFAKILNPDHVQKRAPSTITLTFPPGKMPSEIKPGVAWTI